MGEQTNNSLSISFRVDEGVIGHNNRSILAKNVDAARISENVIYRQTDIREFYAELFGAALAEYNAEQKRKDKKIPDYYEHIKKGKREKPFYEIIVEFGDNISCGRNSGNWELAKQMLDEYMKNFEARNPNLRVFNSTLHLDEMTPHLHIDFVPVAHKAVRGLSLKNSMSGALREQGFTSANKFQNEWVAWEQSEQEEMTRILAAHGLSRDVKNDSHAYLPVDEYKKAAEQKAKIKQINDHINELKKKNAAELTAADFEQISNQNDYMRKTVTECQSKIAELTKKINSPFVPLEIFSEDKLQFVAAELQKRDIPFVEENTTLHIPEYAKEQAAAIAANYKKVQTLGIRERVKLDIDRIILFSTDLESFFSNLKERGYTVNRGRKQDVCAVCPKGEHDVRQQRQTGSTISVKAPFAERAVRLKTLGAAYLPKNLETRITQRNYFTDSVKEKFKTANELEKPFHVTVMNMVIAVKQYRLQPRKTNSNLIYAFTNDANIDYLSRQLKTISEFGFTSREQMYEKAEELQAAGDEAKEQLSRVRELIKAYEAVIEGNYVDNLIKAQQSAQKPKQSAQKR